MKKIINGKKYDTTTAKSLGSWSSPHYHGDFHQAEEELFKTKNGAYFLHGEVGPLSRGAQPCSDGTSVEEDIIPMSEEEARQEPKNRTTGKPYEPVRLTMSRPAASAFGFRSPSRALDRV